LKLGITSLSEENQKRWSPITNAFLKRNDDKLEQLEVVRSSRKYRSPFSPELARLYRDRLIFSDELFQLFDITNGPIDIDGNGIADLVDPHLIPANRTTLHCFRRLSMTPIYGILSLSAHDTAVWKMSVYKLYGLSEPQLCPPKRAIFLTRTDRAVLNRHDLIDRIRSQFGVQLIEATVTGSNSSLEQVELFAQTGLILSAHSSQLINVLFSHPSQSIIEMSAEFYNVDFAAYSRSMGLHFSYAFGGKIPSQPRDKIDPLQSQCLSQLHDCQGDVDCVTERSSHYCKQKESFPFKNSPFRANWTAVEISMKRAMSHLDKNCNGRWWK